VVQTAPRVPVEVAGTHLSGLTVPHGLTGLTTGEAAQLLKRVGPNRGVALDRLGWLRELLHLLLDPMAIMLTIAAAIYGALGETRDAVVLGLALIPVLGVDVLLQARSRSALAKLAAVAAPVAEVVRDQHLDSVAIEDVVPGDLLLLREGHTVAADGVVLWAANLGIDESSLTGES
jgi:Ca2+-transporting ATPase